MAERTNQEWLAELRGPGRDGALVDLRALLIKGLRHAMADRPAVTEVDLEDFVQEALLKMLSGLDTFRHESRFTTWAQKIAVRVAFTELRRRRWRDVSLEEVTGSSDTYFVPAIMADPAVGPEQHAIQHSLLTTLRQTIDEELTDRQRQALVAVSIQGVPLEEVARRMGTNRNALYKLLHDARLDEAVQFLEALIAADFIRTRGDNPTYHGLHLFRVQCIGRRMCLWYQLARLSASE